VLFFSTTFLGLLKLLRSFFIATAKTSYTAGTLCAMGAEFFGIILKFVVVNITEDDKSNKSRMLGRKGLKMEKKLIFALEVLVFLEFVSINCGTQSSAFVDNFVSLKFFKILQNTLLTVKRKSI
jgi:hypothetical protein